MYLEHAACFLWGSCCFCVLLFSVHILLFTQEHQSHPRIPATIMLQYFIKQITIYVSLISNSTISSIITHPQSYVALSVICLQNC